MMILHPVKEAFSHRHASALCKPLDPKQTPPRWHGILHWEHCRGCVGGTALSCLFISQSYLFSLVITFVLLFFYICCLHLLCDPCILCFSTPPAPPSLGDTPISHQSSWPYLPGLSLSFDSNLLLCFIFTAFEPPSPVVKLAFLLIRFRKHLNSDKRILMN